jgi:hypothetical protein
MYGDEFNQIAKIDAYSLVGRIQYGSLVSLTLAEYIILQALTYSFTNAKRKKMKKIIDVMLDSDLDVDYYQEAHPVLTGMNLLFFTLIRYEFNGVNRYLTKYNYSSDMLFDSETVKKIIMKSKKSINHKYSEIGLHKEEHSLLSWAVRNGMYKSVELLLTIPGIDITQTYGPTKKTLLHYYVDLLMGRDNTIIDGFTDKFKSIYDSLITAGMDISQPDNNGDSFEDIANGEGEYSPSKSSYNEFDMFKSYNHHASGPDSLYEIYMNHYGSGLNPRTTLPQEPLQSKIKILKITV